MNTLFNIAKLKERRNKLRCEQTKEEKLLWEFLRKDNFGFRFRRQYGIGGYIADVYCPKKKIVIEIDGSQHFKKDAQEYDDNRTKFFSGASIRVLRFTNEEIISSLPKVITNIKQELHSSPSCEEGDA